MNGELINFRDTTILPMYYWIKYVLWHTELYPKELQKTEFKTKLEELIYEPETWIDYHSFYPYEIKRDILNKLIKYILNIELNNNTLIWVWAESENSEDVLIFEKREDFMNESLKGEYWEWNKNMVSKFLSMNIIWYYSKENWTKFTKYENKYLIWEIKGTLGKVDEVLGK